MSQAQDRAQDLEDLRVKIQGHPSLEDCPDPECDVCAVRDCPHEEAFHYHHDGCPACFFDHPEGLVT